MVSGKEKFGEFVRRRAKAKQIGLREMAKMIGVSPTYLSKIERDGFPPPGEEKVRKIAAIIGCDPDELLARGRPSFVGPVGDHQTTASPGGRVASYHQGPDGRRHGSARTLGAEGKGQIRGADRHD